jgi:hypothetical protein
MDVYLCGCFGYRSKLVDLSDIMPDSIVHTSDVMVDDLELLFRFYDMPAG